MSMMVVNDCELGLVAVEFVKSRTQPLSGTLAMPQNMRHSPSRLAAVFEFCTSAAYPHFTMKADDGRMAISNVVTDERGVIHAYAYSSAFTDKADGQFYPAGRYLVRLATVGSPVADDDGIVTIHYEVEPVRQMGRMVRLSEPARDNAPAVTRSGLSRQRPARVILDDFGTGLRRHVA